MKRQEAFYTETDREGTKYYRTQMQKERIMERLKEKGGRITKQRRMLLDIILESECSSCKEIYYKASRKDKKIGVATVYRMINALEEIGAIDRRKMYQLECRTEGFEGAGKDTCIIELDDHTTRYLSEETLHTTIQAGLSACGYIEKQKVTSVVMRPEREKVRQGSEKQLDNLSK